MIQEIMRTRLVHFYYAALTMRQMRVTSTP